MPAARSLPPASTLPPGFVEMMASGVSCIVSACSATLQPSIMRALGTLVQPGSGEITVFLARSQARQLLQDIADTGRLAVVFSQPSSHRTVQFKARHPLVRAACADDLPALSAYRMALAQELAHVHIDTPFAHAMLAHDLDDMVALHCVPEQAFDQTPGPKAGTALAPADG